MTKPKGEVWFLASCVELYKDEKGMSGQDAYNYFRKTGAVDFITGCWAGLHMTSPLYIIDSIDEYIKTHSGTAQTEQSPQHFTSNDCKGYFKHTGHGQ